MKFWREKVGGSQQPNKEKNEIRNLVIKSTKSGRQMTRNSNSFTIQGKPLQKGPKKNKNGSTNPAEERRKTIASLKQECRQCRRGWKRRGTQQKKAQRKNIVH